MSFIFVLGKAQKISTALYLISALLPETEPLRQGLRQKALDILSDIRTMSDNAVRNESLLGKVRGHLEHTLSLSDLAARSGTVSLMNHEFLKGEVESFVGQLTKLFETEGAGGIAEAVKDIGKEATSSLLLPPPAISKGHPKGHDKGQSVFKTKKAPHIAFGQFQHMKGPIKDIAFLNGGGASRKEKILQIVKEKGSLTIKDIIGVAPEYSEKTIQRDLVEMVENGKLKKRGERRWTVYFV